MRKPPLSQTGHGPGPGPTAAAMSLMPLPSPPRTGIQVSLPQLVRCPTRAPVAGSAWSAVIQMPPAPSGASRSVSARYRVRMRNHPWPS